MKLIINDDKIIVFLNNKKYINFNEEEIEEHFKSILTNLENDYDINSYDNVCVYIDLNYGMIIELENDETDYFLEQNVKVNIFKTNYFLYEIDYNFINKDILKNCELYKYNDKFYIKIKNKLNEKNYLKILEYSDIIYGEKALKIEKTSKKVNYEKTSCSVSRKT